MSHNLAVLHIADEERKVLIPRPATYDAAVKAALFELDGADEDVPIDILVSLDALQGRAVGAQTELAEVTPRSWDLVKRAFANRMLELVVRTHDCDCDSEASSEEPVQPAVAAPQIPPGTPVLFVDSLQGKRWTVPYRATDTMADVKDQIALFSALPVEDFHLLFDGQRVNDLHMLKDIGIEAGDALHLYPVQRGGKPVIYLFSPTRMDATVALSLVPEWTLSCVYPEAKGDGKQEIAWNVSVTGKDGNLVTPAGDEEAYLFWEALTNPTLIDTPPASPAGRGFNPAHADVSPSNSVLLPIKEVPSYLRGALRSLGLHTEARTSFITYWLPALQAHQHVALRFLPQPDYEEAAKLRVVPAPDVVTRVFMLFRGVDEVDLPLWEALALTPDVVWPEVVGVDVARVQDESLFRVLEWGGMEVK